MYADCYIPFSPSSISVPLSLFHSILFTFFTKSLSFHSILTFCFCSHFTFHPILLSLSIPIPYYFPFPFLITFHSHSTFHSSFLSSVAWYWYHKHHLSLIIFNHVLLIYLDNLSTFILPIPHLIFIPLLAQQAELLICLRLVNSDFS